MNFGKNKLVIAGAALILLWLVVFMLQPGPADGECVPAGAPYSGFVDEEAGCGLSDESYAKSVDYESSPKPFRIAGILMVVTGIGASGVARFRRERSTGADE